MSLENIVREIVRDEIAATGSPSAADPVLLTVKEVAAKHPNLPEQLIYKFCREQDETQFPCVRIGEKSILIDNARLNRWIADGGLGVRA